MRSDRDPPANRWLLAGGALSAIAAALHLACIPIGGAAYRVLGAGERMARLADAGHAYPAVMAAAIAAVLLAWSAYALSGAGVIRRLPWRRMVLCGVTAVYLARGVGFVALMPLFPGNSLRFWAVSSVACGFMGLVHLVGLRQAWRRL